MIGKTGIQTNKNSRERLTDKTDGGQTDKTQLERHTDRQTDRQTHHQMDRQTD